MAIVTNVCSGKGKVSVINKSGEDTKINEVDESYVKPIFNSSLDLSGIIVCNFETQYLYDAIMNLKKQSYFGEIMDDMFD